MTSMRAEQLFRNLCAMRELVPEFWNISEPIDQPFDPDNLDPVVLGAMVPWEAARKHYVRTLAFFRRKTTPRYLLAIDLRLAPVQGTSAHNRILMHLEEIWPGGKNKLVQYLLSSSLPKFPDYAKIVESSQEDPQRLAELKQTFAPKQLLESISRRTIKAPFGPYGCLEDIYWFNYVGQAYVDFIGADRLLGAGWARVEKVGDGLACYASSTIDAPSAREQRSRIASELQEFVWSPGCKPESKRVPTFDFSEQTEALQKVSH